MSQPEIFRRCAHCGASSKPGELFCAQCGNALVIEKSDQPAQQIPGASDLLPGTALGQETAGAGDTERLTPQSLQGNEQRMRNEVAPVTATSPTSATVIAQPSQNPGIASQRAGLAARAGMDEKVKPQVDKLRRVSSVVLDEAAYDSSIRFILVVGFLFVLFLLLLFLSKWIV